MARRYFRDNPLPYLHARMNKYEGGISARETRRAAG